ncbi:hypothetical protein BOO69_17685 [Sulfitobacter alexandrii]|uniref:DUF2793 domain-containing protein n=1 Tax=Sulfitobacter alexandrii TaxID=1917485 RepID=A0A1J0WL78_9RHOB|nr:DUF2793 domain-containing protein [Sulfitobacter alexandrii]APE45037.1 hypothetical protein BOO69_17685 [Sulfitobacter alexandrii]
MSETSPSLALPYLQPAQAQKHVTHNEALRILDAVTQLSVLSATLDTPPALPEEGDRHIVGPGATAAWAGQEHDIAIWVDSTWQFFAPRPGWRADVTPTGETLRFDGTVWVAPALAELQNLESVGINASADGTNRLAVSSDATLFTHDGSGHQLKLNKAAEGDTASVLFQTGFAGRAEIGTTGADDFTIKVSADGTSFLRAIHIEPVTGTITIGEASGTRNLLVLAHDAPSVQVRNTGGSGGASFIMTDDPSGGDWKFKITGAGDFKLRNEAGAQDVLKIDMLSMVTSHFGPVQLMDYTVATLPDAAAAGAGAQVFVTNEAGGAVPAFSDGASWRRVTDRAVVS